MTQNLRPSAALSQVVFIHDYLQLAFQDETFTIYNRAALTRGARTLQQSELGFSDELVRLIGARIMNASTSDKGGLVLVFENNTRLTVLSGEGARGPEAWHFTAPERPPVVQQNV